MAGCEVWPDDHGPCGALAIETLFFFNDRCAGQGFLPVCAKHLTDEMHEHLLAKP